MSACVAPSAALLPDAPSQIVMHGAPLVGRYAGRIDAVDWSLLSGPYERPAWWRRMHHKRWQYVAIAHEDVFVGTAIVDLGWSVTAFAYVFDRLRRRVIADWSQVGVPGLSGAVSDQFVQGADARFKGPGASLSLSHELGDVISLQVRTPSMQMQVELGLARAAPYLLAVGKVPGGVAHATQKSPALPVLGWVEAQGQRWSLDHAVGSHDASNGLLPRHTAWRWASAHRRDVGFNLQKGYFGAHENALWLDGELVPLAAAHFEFDPRAPLELWRVYTDDGLLDLHFHPEGGRRDRRNMLVASSRYVQPVGTFKGLVRRSKADPPRRIDGLLGVTEDHASTW